MVLRRTPTLTLVVILTLVGAATATPDPIADLHFRPAAIPLLTTDPFMQTWMRGDTATSTSVNHWDGQGTGAEGALSSG